jgi:hypothetical protein
MPPNLRRSKNADCMRRRSAAYEGYSDNRSMKQDYVKGIVHSKALRRGDSKT